MRKIGFILLAIIQLKAGFAQHPGAIGMPLAKFSTGDDKGWAAPGFDDSQWKEIHTDRVWQSQGFRDYHGYAWYRIHVTIPSSLKTKSAWKDSISLYLAHINDADETYLNGIKIAKVGGFPSDPGGYDSKWPFERHYHLSSSHPAIHWDRENVIAIKVYDGGGTGGIFMGRPYIDMLEKIDGLQIHVNTDEIRYMGKTAEASVLMKNQFGTQLSGTLNYSIYDASLSKKLQTKEIPLRFSPLEEKTIPIRVPHKDGIQFEYRFVESNAANSISSKLSLPYLLTPKAPDKPLINSAKAYGVRPGSPFQFRIAASGKQPIHYQASGLPPGLQLSPSTGLITGSIQAAGEYHVQVTVSNSVGQDKQPLLIKAGETLALTPPMGWNSWNCWGLSVSDEKVKSSAQALIDKGLANYGWTYINIDDGWEADQRNSDGSISSNAKFPDMKELSEWLHSRGLKLGIYSSPGPLTCGGFLGSYGHEQQDADTYGQWGIDYLKYDWCSYSDIAKNDTTQEAYIKPYRIMQAALRKQPRDIYYSLCQYGMGNVGQWAPDVDAQSWRTTGDITDTWQSLYSIGFAQDKWRPYAAPGHWNDPDMMIVGQVGWGENLHPSRLTPDEQYTHVSLWSLLSAPLLIGCDISKIDEFTKNLLTNREVIAINQDVLGKQAKQVLKEDKLQIWVKELNDGSKAIGIFNMDTVYQKTAISAGSIGLSATSHLRDVWRQHDLTTPADGTFRFNLPPHGNVLLRTGPAKD